MVKESLLRRVLEKEGCLANPGFWLPPQEQGEDHRASVAPAPGATWLPGVQGLTQAPREGLGVPIPSANPSPLSSRAVSGVDTDPDLVHMETQDLGGGKSGPGGGGDVPAPGVCPGVLTPALGQAQRALLGSSAGPAQPTSRCYDVV